MRYLQWQWAVIVCVILLSVFGFGGEASAQRASCPLLGLGSGMMSGVWGLGGGIFMLLFWGLIVVGAVLLIRWLMGAGRVSGGVQPAAGLQSPLEILKKRYAQGEINREQYESMKRDLE